jgi:hypothetical protein
MSGLDWLFRGRDLRKIHPFRYFEGEHWLWTLDMTDTDRDS